MLREKAKSKRVGHGWDYVNAAGTAAVAARSCMSPSAAGTAPAAVPIAGMLPVAAVPVAAGTLPAPAVEVDVLPRRSSHRIRRRSSCCAQWRL